jgi:hypothetical protein
MKTKFYLCLIALSMGMYSCQKETAKTLTNGEAIKPSNSSVVRKTSFVTSNDYYYIDLDLLPRASGENFDTFHCLWNDADIFVTNVNWDGATYPTVYTGTNTSIQPTIDYITQSGMTGTLFTVTIPTLCGAPNFTNLHADIDRYVTAMSYTNIVANGLPNSGDYIANDYGNSNCPQTTFKLKLIKSTTSATGYAVAVLDYPSVYHVPNVTTVQGYITSNGTNYYVSGIHGAVTGVIVGNNTVQATGSYGYVSTGLQITATFVLNGVSVTETTIDEW